MDNLPHVSFIIPCLNSEKTISNCIKSILNIDYPKAKYKIIIVDNCSLDSTAKIIQGYPVEYLYLNKKGRAIARNHGAKLCNTELIAFVDSDCVLPTNWLREMVNGFKISSLVFAAQCGIRPIPINKNTFLSNYSAWRYERITYGTFNTIDRPWPSFPKLDTAAVLIERKKFLQLGGFDENLDRFEDRDFGKRGLKNGWSIFLCPELIINKICDNKSWLRYFLDLALDTKGEIISSSISRNQKLTFSKIIFLKIKLYFTFTKNHFDIDKPVYLFIEIIEYFISLFAYFIYSKKEELKKGNNGLKVQNKKIQVIEHDLTIELDNNIMHYMTNEKIIVFNPRIGRCIIRNNELRNFWLRLNTEKRLNNLTENELQFLKSLNNLGVRSFY